MPSLDPLSCRLPYTPASTTITNDPPSPSDEGGGSSPAAVSLAPAAPPLKAPYQGPSPLSLSPNNAPSSEDPLEEERRVLIGRHDLSLLQLDNLHQQLRVREQGNLVYKPRMGKVLIANRGEIALRILRAIEEGNRGLDRDQRIVPVVVYTKEEKNALFVREARRMGGKAYPLEPAASGQPAYSNIDGIIAIAKKFKVDAIHPGYGYKSEDPEFPRKATAAQIAFIGPPAKAAKKAGSKGEFRAICKACGVPVTRGFTEGTTLLEAFEAALVESGLAVRDEGGEVKMLYPGRAKAVWGGGGRGQLAFGLDIGALRAAFPKLVQEATVAFGHGELIAEQQISRFVHIEVQFAVDRFGNSVVLGERECTLQERGQKLVEFSDSPLFDHYPDLRNRLRGDVVKVVRALGYVGIGTMEFMVDPLTGQRYPLEVNARIQVEHVVTEMTSGVDIVREQIGIARGLPLSVSQEQVDQQKRGMAVEVRIKAVNPDKRVSDGSPMPAAGPITRLEVMGKTTWEEFQELENEGVRVETAVEEGDRISSRDDPMFMKVVVWIPESDRAKLLQRVEEVLGRIIIERRVPDPNKPGASVNLPTDLPRQIALIRTRAVRGGDYDNRFVEEWEARGRTEDLTSRLFQRAEVFDVGGGALALRVLGYPTEADRTFRSAGRLMRQLLAVEGPKALARWTEGSLTGDDIERLAGERGERAPWSYSVTLGPKGTPLSVVLWDRSAVPQGIFVTTEAGTVVKEQDKRLYRLEKARFLTLFQPHGQAWETRIWVEGTEYTLAGDLYVEGQRRVLPLTTAPIPFSKITVSNLSGDRLEIATPSKRETPPAVPFSLAIKKRAVPGRVHTIREIEVRDGAGNTVGWASPQDVEREPWEKIPYLLTTPPTHLSEGERLLAKAFDSLAAISQLGRERRKALEALTERPEDFDPALFELVAGWRGAHSKEGVGRFLAAFGLAARRMAVGMKIDSVDHLDDSNPDFLVIRATDRYEATGEEVPKTIFVTTTGDDGFSTAWSAASQALVSATNVVNSPFSPVLWVDSFDGKATTNEDRWAERQAAYAGAGENPFAAVTTYYGGGNAAYPFSMTDKRALTAPFYQEIPALRGLPPPFARLHDLRRWDDNFKIEILNGADPHTVIFRAEAKDPKIEDTRLVGQSLVTSARVERIGSEGLVESIPDFESALDHLIAETVRSLAGMSESERLTPGSNRLVLTVIPPLSLRLDEMKLYLNKLYGSRREKLVPLSLEKVTVRVSLRDLRVSGERREVLLTASGRLDVSSLTRIWAPVRVNGEVKEQFVWVSDETYEHWLREKGNAGFALSAEECFQNRPVRAMSVRRQTLAIAGGGTSGSLQRSATIRTVAKAVYGKLLDSGEGRQVPYTDLDVMSVATELLDLVTNGLRGRRAKKTGGGEEDAAEAMRIKELLEDTAREQNSYQAEMDLSKTRRELLGILAARVQEQQEAQKDQEEERRERRVEKK